MTLRWLDIERGQWSDKTTIQVEWAHGEQEWIHKAKVRLQTPDNRPHVALFEIVD